MGVFLVLFTAAGAVILLLHATLASGILLAARRDSARTSPARGGSRPKAEVIVAVKNEAENLGRLLAALRAQDEPGCLFLFIDDCSADGTRALLDGFCGEMGGRARVLSNRGAPGLTGKQAALDTAFAACSGDILLFTDGDCAMGNGWVRSMVDRFRTSEDTDVVLGRIELESDGSFLHRFQAFEQPFINLYNFGSASIGVPTGCFGNNMAARARAVRETGGFARMGYSVTEDAALLSALSRRKGARVRVSTAAESVVVTRPKKSWAAFLNQHTRWNAGAFFSRDFTTRATYSFIVGYLIACIVALPFGFLDWRLTVLGLNAFLSIGLLGFAGGMYPGVRRAQYYLRLVPYVVFFSFFYSFVSLRALLGRSFEWKGTELGSSAPKK